MRAATNAAGTVTTEYNEAGAPLRTVDVLGDEAIYGYDADGNLVSRTATNGSLASKPNYTTAYSYDAADQLTWTRSQGVGPTILRCRPSRRSGGEPGRAFDEQFRLS